MTLVGAVVTLAAVGAVEQADEIGLNARVRERQAWIRTATALLSFGFTIYKFFELAHSLPAATRRLVSPRQFGLLMIGSGLVALLLGTIEHRRNLRSLEAAHATARSSVAGCLAIMGLLAFAATLWRG